MPLAVRTGRTAAPATGPGHARCVLRGTELRPHAARTRRGASTRAARRERKASPPSIRARQTTTRRSGQWLDTRDRQRLRSRSGGEVAGGSINHCLRWQAQSAAIFLKTAPATLLPMFEAEAAGLRELPVRKRCASAVIGVAAVGSTAVLALEWLDLRAPSHGDAAHARLGALLATQHRVSAPGFRLASRQYDRSDAAAEHAGSMTGSGSSCNGVWVISSASPKRTAFHRVSSSAAACCANGCGAFFSSHRPGAVLAARRSLGWQLGGARDTGEPVVSIPRCITATARPTSR